MTSSGHDDGQDMNDLGRIVVAQAIGILMARHDLDPHEAFGLLSRQALDAHVRVQTVATRLVEEAGPHHER